MHHYKKKDTKNEVTYDVPDYFNACNFFECGRNILNKLDVLYERAYIATPRKVHFIEILNHLNKHNRCHDKPLSSKKLQEDIIRFMEESEEES